MSSYLRPFVLFCYRRLIVRGIRSGVHFRDRSTVNNKSTSLYYALKFRSVHLCSPIPGVCFSFLKNCFRNFPGAKINFVPKGIQVRFEMVEKKVYKQTKRQTEICEIIINVVEFDTRSLNLYLASHKL